MAFSVCCFPHSHSSCKISLANSHCKLTPVDLLTCHAFCVILFQPHPCYSHCASPLMQHQESWFVVQWLQPNMACHSAIFSQLQSSHCIFYRYPSSSDCSSACDAFCRWLCWQVAFCVAFLMPFALPFDAFCDAFGRWLCWQVACTRVLVSSSWAG